MWLHENVTRTRLILFFFDVLFWVLALSWFFGDGLYFATNDDPALRSLADGSYLGIAESNLIFNHPLWGWFLASLYKVVGIDWYSSIYFGISVLGIYGLWLLARKGISNIYYLIFIFSSFVFFLIYAVVAMSFTKVAFILCCLGCAVHLQTYFSPNRHKINYYLLLLSVVLIGMGGCVRFSVLLLSVAMYVAYLLFAYRLQFLKQNLVFVLAVFLVAGTLYGTEVIHYNKLPEWKLYKEYITTKVWFQDGKNLAHYPLPDGWTDCDRYSLESFFYEKSDIFSESSLKKIVESHPKIIVSEGKLLGFKTAITNGNMKQFALRFVPFILLLLIVNWHMPGWAKIRYVAIVLGIILAVVGIYLYIKINLPVLFGICLMGWIILVSLCKRENSIGVVGVNILLKAVVGILMLYMLQHNRSSLLYASQRVKTYNADQEFLENKIKMLPPNARVLGADSYWTYCTQVMFAYPSDPKMYQNFYKMGWPTGMPSNEKRALLLGFVPSKDAPVFFHAVDNKDTYILAREANIDITLCYLTERYKMDVAATKVLDIRDDTGLYQFYCKKGSCK